MKRNRKNTCNINEYHISTLNARASSDIDIHITVEMQYFTSKKYCLLFEELFNMSASSSDLYTYIA